MSMAKADAATDPEISPRVHDDQPRGRSFSSIVMRLSALNAAVLALGVVTGPLQARALGPSGRGELAAITVVGMMLPIIASLGLEIFVTREIARDTPPGEVIGSIGLATVVVGILVAPMGIPISTWLAHGRSTIHLFILLQFLTLPLVLLINVMYYAMLGRGRWSAIMVMRIISALGPAATIVVLFVTHLMTVQFVAIATIGFSFASAIPILFGLRGITGVRFRPSLLRAALPFGLKAWIGTLAVLTNGRLDQLLMISLVSSRQLGLYAVAVTVSSISNQVAYSLSSPLLSRVAAGEHELVRRSLRIALALVAIANAAVAAAIPVLLPLLFGTAFRDAVLMAAILLVAALPLCATAVLSSAMTADGHPGVPAIGEALTLLITIPGLLLLLPPLGGVGAALVSLAAYSANAAYQLRAARINFGGTLGSFIFPKHHDAVWAKQRIRSVLGLPITNIDLVG
jgi:O-antigen/teichoic acid export membrane protein